MCNYKYQKKKHPLENQPCVYPALYNKYPDQLVNGELLTDSEGFCIFHSKNVTWKNQNGFSQRFVELLNGIEEINKTIVKNDDKVKNNFSGFHLCADSKPFVIDNYVLQRDLDFSHSEFITGFNLKDSRISSLTIDYCHFHNTFKLENVYFFNNIDCLRTTFDNGITFFKCELTAFTFFDTCHFDRTDKYESAFSLKKCPTVDYLTFIESRFKKPAVFSDSVFNADVIYDKCIFEDEFYSHGNEVNGDISFKEAQFLLSNNQNPVYSTVDFNGVKLKSTGKIMFIGKKPLEDVIKGELQISFEGDIEGQIFFDNFNLNKIASADKHRLLALEKTGHVEIGKGCRKYYCQTDVITIEASNSNQRLILDITTVFCNYFEIQQGYNLGIEIIERGRSHIKYFYFTDEEISQEELNDRIMQNENSLWQTFSNLTRNSALIVSKKDMETKNCLIDVAGLFLKIGNQIEHNSLPAAGFENVFKAITINGDTSVDTGSLLKQIIFNWQRFDKTVPTVILKSITMGNNYINNGSVNQFGENNYDYRTIISDNSNVTSEQKEIIFKILEDIKAEPIPEKKENKLIKFIKDFGPTIGEAAVKMISATIKV